MKTIEERRSWFEKGRRYVKKILYYQYFSISGIKLKYISMWIMDKNLGTELDSLSKTK